MFESMTINLKPILYYRAYLKVTNKKPQHFFLRALVLFAKDTEILIKGEMWSVAISQL